MTILTLESKGSVRNMVLTLYDLYYNDNDDDDDDVTSSSTFTYKQ